MMYDDEIGTLKLKLLLMQYKMEILKGDKKNTNNLIATKVLLECGSSRWHMVNRELKKFLPSTMQEKGTFKAPTRDQLKTLKSNAKKRVRIGYNDTMTNIAVAWIDEMLKYDVIFEGQTIDPSKYVISDFITDDRIVSLYKRCAMTLENPNPVMKKRKQKF